MFHVWHLFAPQLSAARKALTDAADFIDKSI
jgi:hypothetical protein